MDDDLDEDTQIALLASLLEPASFHDDEYRSALSEAKGNIQKAGENLLLPRVKSSGKRKAGTSLESWLGKKRAQPGKADERNGAVGPLEADAGVDEPDREAKSTIASKSTPKDAFSLLLSSSQKPDLKAKAARQPAVRLYTQAQIDAHNLPLTLLESPLSPAFASALYLVMMEESEKWERNRWYLAGRWVESPHTMASYCRPGDGYGTPKLQQETIGKEGDEPNSKEGEGSKAKYYYTGRELDPPKPYPELLSIAARMIEPVVNAAIKSRRRYPGEWAGDWRANVCGANRYDGASSSVGWHADELSHLGPYTTIASLSLGTPRSFRLRQTEAKDPTFASTKPIRTYETTLGHNSLILMNAGCQERFKHTVPPQKALDLFRPGWDISQQPIPLSEQKTFTTRINITFRFFRDDFHPLPGIGPFGPREGTPRCKCGIPTLLRPDQKAKARSILASPPKKSSVSKMEEGVVDDDMVYFWQCQSPGQSGDMKGCGFFRILDMKAEGRGPCISDVQQS